MQFDYVCIFVSVLFSVLRKFDIGKVPKISPLKYTYAWNSKSDMKSQKNMNPNYQEKKKYYSFHQNVKEMKKKQNKAKLSTVEWYYIAWFIWCSSKELNRNKVQKNYPKGSHASFTMLGVAAWKMCFFKARIACKAPSF